ncbi:MAG: ABC transporter permease [Candidatus Krumholzibacteria bacterium]|nr:ABC transporter permease [Candidatus Krumholzibacteria bacterium]
MKKIMTVIRKEYLERVRSKSFVIGTLLGPALMSMFIVLPMLLADSGGEDERTIAVIDPSGLYFDRLSSELEDRGHETLTVNRIEVGAGGPQAAVEQLKDSILDESVHSGILIDPDFLENRAVNFYNKSVSSLVVRDRMLRPALNKVLREGRFAKAQVPDSMFAYLAARATWTSIAVSAEGGEQEQDEEVGFIMAISLIMIIYMMVLMYGSHTLMAVIEEKSSRMVEVLLASIPPGHLMLGKVLGIGLAGLTQFCIWTGTFFVLSQKGVSVGEFTLDTGFLTPVILISFVMFFLLGFFLYATMFAGVGALCNSTQDAQQFQMPLMMGMMIPMTLLTLVVQSPDSTIAVVLSLVPMFAPVIMFMRVCVETPPFWQIGLSWLLMIVAIVLAARGAGKLFRMGILMYGESPTWATLWKVLRD